MSDVIPAGQAAHPPFATTRRSLAAGAATALLLPRALRAQPTPTRGGVLTISQAVEPPMLCSAFNTSTYIALVSCKVLEGLVRYDADQKPQPLLAESWTVSPDGLTYSFRLRQGVTWHDGKPFTSADVQFTAMEVWRKLHPRSGVTWAALEAVETPDAATAVFRLSRPVPFLLAMLGAWEAQVIAKHIYDGTDIRANPANNAPIGTGPFRFVEWQRGQFVRLEKNPGYWQPGRPYLDGIIIRMMPDAAARAAAFEAQEVQAGFFTPIPLSDLRRVAALPHIAVTTEGYAMFAAMYIMELNTRTQYLKDKRVRQAMLLAMNREFIQENIFFGYGKIATGPLTSASPYYTKEGVPQYGFDAARANRLLDEAGFRRGGGNMRFKASIELTPSSEFSRVSEYMKQALSRVGIDIEIRTSDLGTLLRRLYTDYDFNVSQNFLYMLPDPSAGVQRLYYGPNIRPGVVFSNASGWSTPALDKLWEEALVSTSTGRRKEIFAEAQRVVADELPCLNMFELDFTTITHKRVRDFMPGPDGAYTSMADTWLATT